MPIKSRLIEEKIEELSNRKFQFESELVTAGSELETLRKAIIKGTAETDALVTAQIRVNTIQQTITAFDSQLAALDADLSNQKQLEVRKEIVSKIKLLDDDAEKAGRHFIELFTDTENLNYARFAEMFLLLPRIEDLKFQFGSHVFTLIPNVNRLKRQDLPEVQSELDSLISELLSNQCKLSVLRSDKVFSEREYATDDYYAFKLPDVPLSGWIWLSIRAVGEREQEKQFSGIELPEKKTGFLSQILNRHSLFL